MKAAIGLSRKWDAYEAGREVAKDALDKLGTNPDFLLLFSTIHYKDHGGFKEFLRGVWDILPEGTPLIGGTVTGFIIPRGCYARGATALAVSYEKMDVAIGYGTETKRNPEKAAENCARMIKKHMDKSTYKSRFLFNFISGPVTFKMPGLGREDEIFEKIAKKFQEYKMVLGTSMDDKGFTNYQFFGNKVLSNSIVSLGIATDMNVEVSTTHGMKKSRISFEITKTTREGYIIEEINGKPAGPELYRILNWPKNFLKEGTIHKILYYPLLLRKGDKEIPTVISLMLKNYIITPYKVNKGRVWVLKVSGKSIIDAVKRSVKNKNPEFGLFLTCVTILEALGHNADKIRDVLKKHFKDRPFIMLFCAGEGSYSKKSGIKYANMSYNVALFEKK